MDSRAISAGVSAENTVSFFAWYASSRRASVSSLRMTCLQKESKVCSV